MMHNKVLSFSTDFWYTCVLNKSGLNVENQKQQGGGVNFIVVNCNIQSSLKPHIIGRNILFFKLCVRGLQNSTNVILGILS